MLTLFQQDWREIWSGLTVPESGSVYTKPEIVALILDLLGYTSETPDLLGRRLLEPSCGDGAFMTEILTRLIASARRGRRKLDWDDERWDTALTAVDISLRAVDGTRAAIAARLEEHGCPPPRATRLAETWAYQTDFLLHDWARARFDFVVGNPPYVRLEDMPPRVLQEYRATWPTATDRADLYIPFFECGLHLLGGTGALAFICANRFAKNQYGAALRRLISSTYHVRHYINLEHTQPFLQDVSAYPAIIVLDRQRGQPTHAATVDDLSSSTLSSLLPPPNSDLRNSNSNSQENLSQRFESWYPDGAPWISTSRSRQASLDALARDFPTIEESLPGTKIGIGIATGADDIFILPALHPAIEPARQVPLVMAGDIHNSGVEGSGHYLVNPFSDAGDGSLADFREFPGFAAYIHAHAARLKARHCARNRPHHWYRTIDRFWPALTTTPKLVIPDIQPGGIIGFDPGTHYPHHNVYWITSTTWDLRKLQALLQSDMVTDQLRAHSVAMRGGSLRYQAQNLRRVRIPV